MEDSLVDDDQSVGQDSVRACLFNLILVGRQPPGCSAFQRLVDAIIERYPCRIICINIRTDQSADFLEQTADIQTVGEGSHRVSCDRIGVEVGGSQRRRVPLIILPLLVSDLPVHLVWKLGPNEERETLLRLQKLTQRVIFDSDGAPSASNFCCSLVSDMSLFRADITDLNWAFIQGWRSALAEAFPTKDDLEFLRRTRVVNVSFNNRQETFCARPELPALMLQAWLAGRLEWTFQKNDGHQITYQRPNGETQVKLIPTIDQDLPAATILSVELISDDNQRRFLQLEKGLQRVRVETVGLPHYVPLRDTTREEAVLDQLFIPYTSRQLRPTLETLCLVEGGPR